MKVFVTLLLLSLVSLASCHSAVRGNFHTTRKIEFFGSGLEYTTFGGRLCEPFDSCFYMTMVDSNVLPYEFGVSQFKVVHQIKNIPEDHTDLLGSCTFALINTHPCKFGSYVRNVVELTVDNPTTTLFNSDEDDCHLFKKTSSVSIADQFPSFYPWFNIPFGEHASGNLDLLGLQVEKRSNEERRLTRGTGGARCFPGEGLPGRQEAEGAEDQLSGEANSDMNRLELSYTQELTTLLQTVQLMDNYDIEYHTVGFQSPVGSYKNNLNLTMSFELLFANTHTNQIYILYSCTGRTAPSYLIASSIPSESLVELQIFSGGDGAGDGDKRSAETKAKITEIKSKRSHRKFVN